MVNGGGVGTAFLGPFQDDNKVVNPVFRGTGGKCEFGLIRGFTGLVLARPELFSPSKGPASKFFLLSRACAVD
jgi:hypothetical protein